MHTSAPIYERAGVLYGGRTMLPYGNPIMYYGYVKFEENLAYLSAGKQKMFEHPRIRDRFTPRLGFPSHVVSRDVSSQSDPRCNKEM